eukprot:SAG22_NODE_21686_length_255_cov_0.615385_1_plen_84_part_11
MQSYTAEKAAERVAPPPSSFSGLESLGTGKTSIAVSGAGALRLDFGVERAAWLEFVSPDLDPTVAGSVLTAAISEYNEPWQVRA